MGRTKKLNSKFSKFSKSRRANNKKNVRISKKKVGGGGRKSMKPGRFSKTRTGRRTPQTKLFGNPAGKKRGERRIRERAENAIKELLKVILEYKTNEDPGKLWIKFLMALRHTYIPGEIRLDYKILEHFRKLVLSKPQEEENIKQFLTGPAQTGERIDFTDMGFMADGKAFPTWLLEQLEGNLEFVRGTSVYQESPV
jgi:hypothetical protein